MVTRDAVVAEARTWLGTPYRHQGRLKGVSCDCIGLVVEVAKALGLCAPEFSIDGYDRRPDGLLIPGCEKHMNRILISEAKAGDVLVFSWKMEPRHVAIITEKDQIIHAYIANRKVVEHTINDWWRGLIHAAYAIEGVA